jgi:glycosyltransferase involved in cell wall biosynthesis
MRIVIDMQSAQVALVAQRRTSYGHLLSQALVHLGEEHEILLALNGFIEDSIEPIRTAFVGMLPETAMRVWYAPGPFMAGNAENRSRRRIAEIIRETFLASLNPDCVVLIDPFYGYTDDMVATIGDFTPDVPTLVAMGSATPPEQDNATELVHFLRQAEQLKRSSGVFVRGVQSVEGLGRALGLAEVPIHPLGDYLDSADLSVARDAQILLAEASSLSGLGSRATSLRERPRLAFVSPLPPARTGIADYSAELLPALSAYYAIDVVTDQREISDPWILANCEVRSVTWFAANGRAYERVLYQIGNSQFHSHMFELVEDIPGVVVLHDFFLGDAQWYREVHDLSPNAWTQALYASHGYDAVQHRLHAGNESEVVRTYPANFEVISSALGVIVHAEHSRRLGAHWYDVGVVADWAVIPLLRVPAAQCDRATCRRQLHFEDSHFVVCSFGFVGPTKLNHELLHAWLRSSLSRNQQCELVFVGEAPDSEYGQKLRDLIAGSDCRSQIRITGYTERHEYRRYLSAADLAVQLRAHSRGEMSATVLDCMNHDTPIITNANGAIAELPEGSVWMLPDHFAVEDLTCALESLFLEETKRNSLRAAAKRAIIENHSPAICANLYHEALEHFYGQTWKQEAQIASKIAIAGPSNIPLCAMPQVSEALASTFPKRKPGRCIYVDVTATCANDLRTGIERVARALSLALISETPTKWRVEPVCLDFVHGRWCYRTARKFTMGLLEHPFTGVLEEVVEPTAGDVVVSVDISGDRFVSAAETGLFARLRARDVRSYCIVHDLLPLRLPHTFPPGADCAHEKWLHAVLATNGAICISKSVSDDLLRWLGDSKPKPFLVTHFHLGADLDNSAPSRGMPPDAGRVLQTLNDSLTFLLVGTIEPRKAYLQVIDAFSELWRDGLEVNLAIVGKEGWQDLPDGMRRTIPETVERLRNHPELHKRLFWLEDISDEYLERVYGAAGCLIAASKGEGFGLPLIEASAKGLPIIARDIPVFREVAGDHAYYFQASSLEDMKGAILKWLSLYQDDLHPKSIGISRLTWSASARQLLASIGVCAESGPCEKVEWSS